VAGGSGAAVAGPAGVQQAGVVVHQRVPLKEGREGGPAPSLPDVPFRPQGGHPVGVGAGLLSSRGGGAMLSTSDRLGLLRVKASRMAPGGCAGAGMEGSGRQALGTGAMWQLLRLS
jgi:hypothetical protein